VWETPPRDNTKGGSPPQKKGGAHPGRDLKPRGLKKKWRGVCILPPAEKNNRLCPPGGKPPQTPKKSGCPPCKKRLAAMGANPYMPPTLLGGKKSSTHVDKRGEPRGKVCKPPIYVDNGGPLRGLCRMRP